MSDRFNVTKPQALQPFLFDRLSGWSKSTVKQRLGAGRVFVNDRLITQHDHPLVAGDRVEVRAAQQSEAVRTQRLRTQALDILYQDAAIVAINKPAGLLSVANADTKSDHALGLLRQQLGRHKAPVKLWPAHRLDRDTSGVLLFTTSAPLQKQVQMAWDKASKTYLAVVQGKPKLAQGTIDQPLRMDEKLYHAHVGPHPDAKPALTDYKVVASAHNRSLLEVTIHTGRQHQIRAHMAWLGHPIIGDERYGNAGERMGLHAMSLQLPHPESQKPLQFVAPVPADFRQLIPLAPQAWDEAISGFRRHTGKV
ncbi:RluA family pseudouridine synthase [Simiduia agarivorans]|uniref:Pseudouridine synthase n=1 Tax=Simiduia agarivorans (strain DSM 21679 / JCM 13881 / BCRC 17597 / SA1) TaxID=1117647 RepID=K4KHE3_SIMAS|nr:RluA family pseudouridine synthase [Simiduia agarivorans]AFU98529.1 pseudouridine synthase [Simiduia agarivorans SA1 = DSM 21679]